VCKVEFVQLDEENNDGFNRKYLLFWVLKNTKWDGT
jgi:hypothetical protein